MKLDKSQIGKMIAIDVTLLTVPTQGIFRVADDINHLDVFVQPGLDLKFDFSKNIGEKIIIFGTVIMLNEITIMVQSIELITSKILKPINYEEKYNKLKNTIQIFINTIYNTTDNNPQVCLDFFQSSVQRFLNNNIAKKLEQILESL